MVEDIRNVARRMGIRLTRDINGKRIRVSSSELKKKIKAVGGSVPNPVKQAKKLIQMCRLLLENVPVPKKASPPAVLRAPPPPPPPVPRAPPPPPPPPRPAMPNVRGNLMQALKLNLARRGLAKN